MGRAAAAATARPAPVRSRPKARPKAKARRAPRGRVAGGAVWIGLVSALLAGVVALNVAVLRLNVRLEELGSERSRLRAESADLSSQIAARASSGRIQTLARGRLGLEPAATDQWTYLDLRRPAR